MEVITLAHGNGGEETYKLINEGFLRYFNNNNATRGFSYIRYD